MLDAPAQSTLSALSRSAVVGKPMVVSEYNHPFPSDYGCEMPLLLAAYASLQDWDAVYGYTFGHQWTERELSGDAVTGYFDLCNEVSKLAQMPTASLLFQRGDVRPARQLVKLDFDEHRLYDSLKEKRWDGLQFFTDGELSPFLPLVHRLRIGKFGAARTTRAADIAFQEPDRPHRQRHGQLLWEATGKGTGRLTINTPHTQAAIGWIGGQTLRTARHRVPSHDAILRRQPHRARWQTPVSLEEDSARRRRTMREHRDAMERRTHQHLGPMGRPAAADRTGRRANPASPRRGSGAGSARRRRPASGRQRDPADAARWRLHNPVGRRRRDRLVSAAAAMTFAAGASRASLLHLK